MNFVIWVTFLGLSGPNNAAAWPENSRAQMYSSYDACAKELPAQRAGFNRASFSNLNPRGGVVRVECKNVAELTPGWEFR